MSLRTRGGACRAGSSTMTGAALSAADAAAHTSAIRSVQPSARRSGGDCSRSARSGALGEEVDAVPGDEDDLGVLVLKVADPEGHGRTQ